MDSRALQDPKATAGIQEHLVHRVFPDLQEAPANQERTEKEESKERGVLTENQAPPDQWDLSDQPDQEV